MAVERFGTYTQRMLDALSDRDPFEVLRETPGVVRATVEAVPLQRLVRPEAEGKWSALEVMHHLADSDLAVGFRFRMILAHERPEIGAYDQDLWARRLHYNDADPRDVLDDFESRRRSNVSLSVPLRRAA